LQRTPKREARDTSFARLQSEAAQELLERSEYELARLQSEAAQELLERSEYELARLPKNCQLSIVN